MKLHAYYNINTEFDVNETSADFGNEKLILSERFERRHIMRRIKSILMITVCILAIGSWSYAQGNGSGRVKGCGRGVGGPGCSANYVDSNGDGICDNAGKRGAGKGQGYRGRGKNGAGKGAQRGPNFVDEDGDGVCDNLQQKQN
jgi:hypothetical protein